MGAQQSDCDPHFPMTNISEGEDDFVNLWLWDDLSISMVTVILPLLFFVGLAGNLAFLFVMARVSWMHTVTNYYLANLAVADISFLVAAIGVKMWAYWATPFSRDTAGFMGRSGCIIVHFLKNLTLFASLFLVTLVSLERFYAICKPVQHWMLSDKGRTVKLVAVTWFLALIFSCGLIPANSGIAVICFIWPDTEKYRDFPNVIGNCHPAVEWMRNFSLGMQTVPFTIAMVGNITLYIMIIKNLNQRVAAKEKKQATRQDPAAPNPSNLTQSHHIRNTVARMLIINGTLFFICLSPFQFSSFGTMIVQMMGYAPTLQEHQIRILLVVCQTCSYINSVVNPFVYTVTNKRYRHAFYVAFTFSRSEQRQRYSKNTSVVTTDMSTRM